MNTDLSLAEELRSWADSLAGIVGVRGALSVAELHRLATRLSSIAVRVSCMEIYMDEQVAEEARRFAAMRVGIASGQVVALYTGNHAFRAARGGITA